MTWDKKHNYNSKKHENVKLIETYIYNDKNGILCFEKLRYLDLDTEKKFFRFRRPDPDNKGKYIWNLDNITLVPYRLDSWKDKSEVVICEGEKDANNLFTATRIETTSAPFGAGAWPKELTSWFKGKIVRICYDIGTEKAVSSHAEKLLSTAKKISIIKLPSAKIGYDLSDYLAENKDKQAEAVLELYEKHSKHYKGSPLNPTADEIEEKEIDWLGEGRFPLGFTTLIVGDSGVNKSFIVIDFAARISTGKDWPDGSPCPKGKVLLMNMVENDQNSITKPALRVAGADLKNVTIEGIFKETGEVFDLLKHEARIRSYFDSGEYKAWFLDILLDYTGGKVDFNKAQSIRPVMNQLNKIAAEYHIAVFAVLHFGKDFSKPAFLRFAGSHQIRAGVKVIYLVGIDPDDPELNPAEKRRFLMPEKQNLGGRWKKSWALHMRSIEGERMGRIEWDEDLEHVIDPNYIVSYSDPSGEILETIKLILKCLMGAKDYSMYSPDIRKIIREESFTEKEIKAARRRLKGYVIIEREPVFHAKVIWKLNITNYKLYDLLEKYGIGNSQRTSEKEMKAPEEDLKEKAERKIAEGKAKQQQTSEDKEEE